MIYMLEPVAIAVAIVLLTFAHYRLTCAAQALRLELATRGEHFLSKSDLKPDMRAHVESMLDSAFGSRLFLFIAMLAIPFIAVAVAFRQRIFDSAINMHESVDTDSLAELEAIERLHDRITLLNNPILLPIVELELLVFIAPALLVRAVVLSSITVEVRRETVLTWIENFLPNHDRLTGARAG